MRHAHRYSGAMTKTDRQELAFGVTAPMLIAAVGFWAWGIEGAIAALLFVIIITITA